MREYHVRICEGLGVKLPGSTRQIRPYCPRDPRYFARPVCPRKRTRVRGALRPDGTCSVVSVTVTPFVPFVSTLTKSRS